MTYCRYITPMIVFWLSILNYAMTYFQKYQNVTPDIWFSVDVELITTISWHHHTQRSLIILELSIKSLRGNQIILFIQIYQNWNDLEKGCFTKERTGIECTCIHVYYTCRKDDHKIHQCPRMAASKASNLLIGTNIIIISQTRLHLPYLSHHILI